jgi:hypothetical protein
MIVFVCPQVNFLDADKFQRLRSEGRLKAEIIDECALLRTEGAGRKALLSGPENIDKGNPKVILKFPDGSCKVTIRYARHL